jgi:hypothetical protein
MKAPWGPIGSAKVTAQNQVSSVSGIRVTDEKQRQARTAEADLAVYLSGPVDERAPAAAAEQTKHF